MSHLRQNVSFSKRSLDVAGGIVQNVDLRLSDLLLRIEPPVVFVLDKMHFAIRSLAKHPKGHKVAQTLFHRTLFLVEARRNVDSACRRRRPHRKSSVDRRTSSVARGFGKLHLVKVGVWVKFGVWGTGCAFEAWRLEALGLEAWRVEVAGLAFVRHGGSDIGRLWVLVEGEKHGV